LKYRRFKAVRARQFMPRKVLDMRQHMLGWFA